MDWGRRIYDRLRKMRWHRAGSAPMPSAAFNDGQIDFYRLESDGNIIDSSEGSTFADTTSYPTGLAWLEQTLASGETQTTIFVSLGGSNRIDAYAVGSDGSLPQRPFSSTTPIDGTFPADVLVYVP